MYNEERKQEYMRYLKEDLKQTSDGIKGIFNKTEAYEDLLNKDICDFTLIEIDKLLPTFSAASVSAIRRIISLLRKYTDWCCSCNISIDNINHYDETGSRSEDLHKYLNKEKSICPTREQVLKDISKFRNYADKFLVLALFEGVRTENIGELLKVKIDKLNGNVLTFENGEKRILSSELVEIAEASSKEEEYVSASGTLSALNMEGNIVNSRKNVRSNEMETLNMRVTNRLGVLRKEETIPYLTIPRLYTAGIVEQLRIIMKKYNLSKEMVFEECYIQQIGSNYDVSGCPIRVLKSRFYNYL